jgi:malate dehydrogenase
MGRVKVAVTGAAGQIGYSLVFRLASGEVFGKDTEVELNLMDLPQAMKGIEGVAMELQDSGFPTLARINCFDQAKAAFSGVHWALLVGSTPRGPGMERSDLIKVNGPIFVEQGKALNYADSSLRVVVVGNPCNTNALIAQKNCQDIPASRFSAMTALDELRAKAQIAKKANLNVGAVTNMAVWGNHSTTMYPNFEQAKINGKPAPVVIEERSWFTDHLLPSVQNRGAEILAARGKSSAASAASACISHMKNFMTKTPAGDWFSAAVLSDGQHYGIPQGLMYSFPLVSSGDGNYRIVEGLELSAFSKEKLNKSAEELLKERELVKDLLG